MYKTFVAGIAALSISVTPVQANGLRDDDLGKLLFGLVAAVTIGAAIKNQNTKTPTTTQAHQTPRPRWSEPRHPPRTSDFVRGHGRSKVLPRDCLASFDTRSGQVRMFERSCISENYRFADSLPRACAVRSYTSRGPRGGWDPQCLHDQGYTVARRH